MATATEQQQTVRALRGVDAALRDLPQIATEWESLDDGEQMAWAIQWGNEMAKLEHLARDAATGALATEQYAHCRRLIERAKELVPVMRQLALYHPRVLTTD